MNYKITCHLMPWELDYALLTFTQLKKSGYHLNGDDKVYIDVTLNLSNYLINWDKTSISKDFFISKFKNLQPLLEDRYICRFKVHEGNILYGGLNTVYESTEEHIDYYIILNPDMYFSEHLLFYLIHTSKHISNEYFVITPQIPKLWDWTWDSISHPNYKSIDYDKWDSLDVFDVRSFSHSIEDNIELEPLNIHKFAGWFDLYNKKMWDNFYGIEQKWNGYGGHDFYAMQLSQFAKNKGVDFQQYILTNQIVCEYEIGPLGNGNLSNHYKSQIVMNDIPNQRKQYDAKMNEYLQIGVNTLKEKNII